MNRLQHITFLILAATSLAAGALAGAEAGLRPLLVTVDGVVPGGNAAEKTPQAVAVQLIRANSQTFREATVSESADATIRFEEDTAGGKDSWFFSINDERIDCYKLDGLEAGLANELQRRYIIMNLRDLPSSSQNMHVSLSVVGDKKEEYQVGEELRFRVESNVDGYLYLVNLDPLNQLHIIFPKGEVSNRIHASEPLNIGATVSEKGPFGRDFVKALVTTAPIDLGTFNEGQDLTTKLMGYKKGSVKMMEYATADLEVKTVEK